MLWLQYLLQVMQDIFFARNLPLHLSCLRCLPPVYLIALLVLRSHISNRILVFAIGGVAAAICKYFQEDIYQITVQQ